MYNGLKITLTFVLGAAVGSAVTWKVLKDRYENLVQEDIDSFKKKMAERSEETESEPDSTEDTDTSNFSIEERYEYERMAKRYINKPEEKGGQESMDESESFIEVLPPDEFGQDEEYDTESLICYTDGVVTDDQGNVIEDIEGTIGTDTLDRFGEWEEDFVYVRNERYKTEYEIFKDYRKYTDVFVDPMYEGHVDKE